MTMTQCMISTDYNNEEYISTAPTLSSTLTTTENSDAFIVLSDIACSPLNENTKGINKYDQQVANYRYKNHWEFIEKKRKINDTKPTSNTYDINKIKEIIKRIKSSSTTSNHVNKWPKNTILVASDSMLSGLDERRLGSK